MALTYGARQNRYKCAASRSNSAYRYHDVASGRSCQVQLRRLRNAAQLLDDFEIVGTGAGIDGYIGDGMELCSPIEVFREDAGLNRRGVEELRKQFRKMFLERHPA